jgi:transglutaminase-like putative cysteine protease
MMNSNTQYLAATPALDWQHPAVMAFAERHRVSDEESWQTAVALYLAVRDGIRYDPYRLDLTIDGMKASTTLVHGYGWCVPKAVLLAACCRACGIPARLGFGDVKNHMTTSRLRERMGTDIFHWHGYTEIWLEDRWIKATPAFNAELCGKLNVAPLEFDGRQDSLLQPIDNSGHRYLEYLRQRGSFTDLPLTQIIATFGRRYPRLLAGADGDFSAEVAAAKDLNKDYNPLIS